MIKDNDTLAEARHMVSVLASLITAADRDPINIVEDMLSPEVLNACERIDGDLYYCEEWKQHGKRGKDGDRVQAVRVKMDGTFDTRKVNLYCETTPTEYGEPDDYFWYIDEDEPDVVAEELRHQLNEANKKLLFINDKIKEELC